MIEWDMFMRQGSIAGLLLLLACGVIWLVWSDIKTRHLPDSATAILAVIALCDSMYATLPTLPTITDRLIGMASLFSVFMLIRWTAKRFLHEEGLGLGDVKLAAMAGLWIGWQAAIQFAFLGAVIGLAFAAWIFASRRMAGKRPSRHHPGGAGFAIALGVIAFAQHAGVIITPVFPLDSLLAATL